MEQLNQALDQVEVAQAEKCVCVSLYEDHGSFNKFDQTEELNPNPSFWVKALLGYLYSCTWFKHFIIHIYQYILVFMLKSHSSISVLYLYEILGGYKRLIEQIMARNDEGRGENVLIIHCFW